MLLVLLVKFRVCLVKWLNLVNDRRLRMVNLLLFRILICFLIVRLVLVILGLMRLFRNRNLFVLVIMLKVMVFMGGVLRMVLISRLCRLVIVILMVGLG